LFAEVLREGLLVRVRILEDVSSRVGGWEAAAAETVGFTTSTMGNTRSAASGKDENCDHIVRRITILFVEASLWEKFL
jgi:hypothetical protein